MPSYYNEIDPKAAAWLRELIKQGHIASGEVDERSIADVKPEDLHGFVQRHFFAGIGVWSHALRCAGWPDDRPVWTGSCPCQSFSAAGKGAGFDDPRHLWPHFYRLIRECRPPVVFGEQVEAAIRFGWLDLVQTDLEGSGYAFGAVGFPAASVGAPHIRQRLYFVGRAEGDGREVRRDVHGSLRGKGLGEGCDSGIVADNNEGRWKGQRGCGQDRTPKHSEINALGNTRGTGLAQQRCDGGVPQGALEPREGEGVERADASTFWSDCDWLPCRDGKWRPVEPGTFPLAHGSAARVGRLRGYGNAIVAPQAQAFIEAYLET